MRSVGLLVGLVMLPVLFIGLGEGATLTAAVQTPAEGCEGDNLLVNPSFEGDYHSFVPPKETSDCPAGVCTTAQMAEGWIPFWRSHNPSDPNWIMRMPEYKPADPTFTDPVRVRTGERAQQYFSFFSTHEAGILQQIDAVPGADYCFSIWGHSWSADDDDDAYTGPEEGPMRQRIGIDPMGGTDWQSQSIIWGESRVQRDEYGLFQLRATAAADKITIFAYTQPDYARKHNDVYWDDAAVTLLTPPALYVKGGGTLAAIGSPLASETITKTLAITFGSSPTATWKAEVIPGGTFMPKLSATEGGALTPLIITVETAELPLGIHTAQLTLSSNPALPNSPITYSIQAIVVSNVVKLHLPYAQRQ